jgi:predicted amidohydrolase YtcJ
MKKVGVIASIQPHFLISDSWVSARLGKTRARWTYAFRSLLKEGIVVIGGSDAPVEPISPLLGIYASVARETFQEERLKVDEALRLYTSNAAFASFEENAKGSITPGKLGDMVVLSQNPYAIPPHRLREIKVEMTIVGGKILYQRR